MTVEHCKSARIAAAKAYLLQSFELARLAHGLDKDDAALILADLNRMLSATDQPPAPPVRAVNAVTISQAPELWSERRGRNENPIAFIRRVYAPYLGNGMTRPLLRQLDWPLYRALSVWELRHPADRMHDMPTKSDLIDRKIAELAARGTPDELRSIGLTLQARRRAARKSPPSL